MTEGDGSGGEEGGRGARAHETRGLTYSFFTLIFLLLGPTAPGVTGVECAIDQVSRRRGTIINGPFKLYMFLIWF